MDVEIWKREPFVTSLKLSHARGLLPITNQSPFKKKYDEHLFNLAISSEEIKQLMKLFHQAGAEYFELYQDTIHIWIDLDRVAVREILRKVWPGETEIIYFVPARRHRQYKVTIHRWNSKRILVKFPRSKRAGFYPVSIFSNYVRVNGPDADLWFTDSEAVKRFIELLFQEGVGVGPRVTKMWIYGTIETTRVRDILLEIYDQGWLNVQIV
jgi:hypothetical protein